MKRLKSGANTALFTHGCSACRAGCRGSPRVSVWRCTALQGGGKEQQRGGPSAVSVVGQMFNFTPFFHTLEVITARKRGAQNPAQQGLKGWVEQERWPVPLILSFVCHIWNLRPVKPYLKKYFLKKSTIPNFCHVSFQAEFILTGHICTSSVIRLSTHRSQTCRSSRCCKIYHLDGKIPFQHPLPATDIYFIFFSSIRLVSSYSFPFDCKFPFFSVFPFCRSSNFPWWHPPAKSFFTLPNAPITPSNPAARQREAANPLHA